MNEEEQAKSTARCAVSDFLEKPRSVSDGGWAPVSEEDFKELGDVIHDLIRARWGEDPDGDLPVEFDLINRTTHQRQWFLPVPYARPCENPIEQAKQDSEHLEMVLRNLRHAADALGYGSTDHIFKFIRGLDASDEATEETG